MIEKLILGTVQMGLPYGVNNSQGQISMDESFEILSEAYSAGIRMLDTAVVYGDAHRVIGKFHKSNPDKTFKVVTKIPVGRNTEDIEITVQQYLDRLQVQRLEALMFHSYASYKSQPELADELQVLKKNGMLKRVGVSVYTNREVELVTEDKRIDLIQLPFNLLDNHNLRGDVLKKVKEKGKIIHTRSAFVQGLFFISPFETHPITDPLKNELSRINEIANDNDIPIETLALQYCLQQPYIDNVIIGVDSLEQLKSNIDACIASLEAENVCLERYEWKLGILRGISRDLLQLACQNARGTVQTMD